MLANTQYTKATMDVDHYWDATAPGAHQHCQLKAKAADPAVLLAGTDLITYAKVSGVTGLPEFFEARTPAAGVLGVNQIFGVQAHGLLEWNGANMVTVRSYNCAIASLGLGKFTVTFTAGSALPSEYYVINGGAIADSAATDTECHFVVDAELFGAPTKTNLGFKFRVITETSGGIKTAVHPIQVWFTCFGG
jgi:hypothetical protein